MPPNPKRPHSGEPITDEQILHADDPRPQRVAQLPSNTVGARRLKKIEEHMSAEEIGVKFQPVGTNLMFTAALFEINQNDILTADPATFVTSLQTDSARSRGFELEARGNITRELEIVAAYTKIDAKVIKSLIPANVDKYVNGVPLDQAQGAPVGAGGG